MVAQIIDDFNRPDGLLSAPTWLLVGGSTGYPTISGGAAGAQAIAGSANTYSTVYNDVLDDDDMEVTVVVGSPAVGGTGTSIQYSILWLGVTNQSTSGTAGTVSNGAYLQFRPGQTSGANSMNIGTVIGGTAINRANPASAVTFATGDVVTFRRVGATYLGIVNGAVVCAWADTDNLLARGSGNRSVGMRFASSSSTVRSTSYDSFTAKTFTAPVKFVDSSFNSTGTSTGTASADVTCTYPAASAPGDLLVMFAGYQRSTASGTQTLATPSGWTLVDSDSTRSSSSGMTTATYYRFRGAETSVTVTASNATSQYGTLQIHAYRGSIDPSTPIDASALSYSTTTFSSAARTFPAVTTTTADSPVSYMMYMEKTTSGTLTFGGVAAEVVDAYSGTTGKMLFGSAITYQPVAGLTGTANVTPNASSNETFLETVAIRVAQNLSLTDSDVGAGTETQNKVTATAPAATDTGTGTEPTAQSIAVKPQTPDTGTGTETQSKVTASAPPAADTGTGTETQNKVTATVTADDAFGTTVEDAKAINTALGSDAGLGTELTPSTDLRAVPGETGTSAETQSITATAPPATDTGVGGEAAAQRIAQAAPADANGPTAEDARVSVRPIAADASGPTIEAASFMATVYGSDSGTGIESTVTSVRGAGDTGTGTDSAFKSISGILDTPRLLTVPRDDRRFVVPRENRTITVAPEVRRIVIGKELAARSKLPHRNARTLGIPAEKRVLIVYREE